MIEKADLIKMVEKAAGSLETKPEYKLAISLLAEFVKVNDYGDFKRDIDEVFSGLDLSIAECGTACIEVIKRTHMQPWDLQNLQRVFKFIVERSEKKGKDLEKFIQKDGEANLMAEFAQIAVFNCAITLVVETAGVKCKMLVDPQLN